MGMSDRMKRMRGGDLPLLRNLVLCPSHVGVLVDGTMVVFGRACEGVLVEEIDIGEIAHAPKVNKPMGRGHCIGVSPLCKLYCPVAGEDLVAWMAFLHVA
jgi:hypothetical protein